MKRSKLIYILAIFTFTACSDGNKKEEGQQKNDTIADEIAVTPNENATEKVAYVDPAAIQTFKNGDIIFQSTESEQSDYVSLVTQSPFSHCGIITLTKNGVLMVLEANGSVRSTPLKDWITNGKESKFAVMRLKTIAKYDAPTYIKKAEALIKNFTQKPYDTEFIWSDDKIYCSELVWKIFKHALNVELCPTRKLKEYDLSDAKVKSELERRYDGKIPYDEPMVAPSDIAASDLMEMIYSNY